MGFLGPLVVSLLAYLPTEALYERFKDVVTINVLRRFLTARNNDVAKATQL